MKTKLLVIALFVLLLGLGASSRKVIVTRSVPSCQPERGWQFCPADSDKYTFSSAKLTVAFPRSLPIDRAWNIDRLYNCELGDQYYCVEKTSKGCYRVFRESSIPYKILKAKLVFIVGMTK